ncbi:hypothetical protein V5N11_019393 [Cardamine amara subsp. amara]|uniref:Uncharacterized protein n=1 Tax=Cardamine amara subsp. amara TaxID=228776 RepID=A0ABD1AIV1_CARAN
MSVGIERKAVVIDQKVARENFSRVFDMIFLFFVWSMQSLGITLVISYMNPDYKCYTRNTAAADVIKSWEKEKEIMKSELQKIPNRVCLASYCWTNYNKA